MDVTIRVETPLQDDVRIMVSDLNDHMRPLSPPEFQFQLTVEEMAESSVTVFIARDTDGQALGMASLKIHDDTLGEVKRMYTQPNMRSRRLGSALLSEVENFSINKGLRRLVLETGEAPGFEAAWRLYERNGYRVCGAVLDYPDSGHSRFYEKNLTR